MRAEDSLFRVYYRLGIAADAGPLGLESNAYYGMALGANVAAWGQSWCATLLTQTAKPYFIDPVTYVFAQDPQIVMKEDEMRQSYVHLVSEYGGILPSYAGKKRLRPAEFLKAEGLSRSGRELVDAVVNFEFEAMERGTATQLRISDYLEMIGEKPATRELKPEFLVPPYFYASDLRDPWYAVSLGMANYAAREDANLDVVPVVCLSNKVLRDAHSISRIVTDFRGFDRVLIWISGFDETRAPVADLSGYAQLVRQFATQDVVPLALYGGFFAVMLATIGLRGLSSGVCYAESKNVARQATGGGAPIRYYVPWAHSKVVMAEAISYYSSNPEEFCRCAICRAALDSTTAPTRASRITGALNQLNRSSAGRHFMRIRAREVQAVQPGSKTADYIRALRSDLRIAERTLAATLGIPTSQLTRWKSALEGL